MTTWGKSRLPERIGAAVLAGTMGVVRAESGDEADRGAYVALAPAPAVNAFYASREGRLAWLRHRAAVIDVLAHAEDDGLDPAAYRVPAFDGVFATPEETARADAALTDALAQYLRDLHDGRVPAEKRAWEMKPSALELEPALQEIAEADDPAAAIRAQAPAHREYAALRRALVDLRAAQERGGWPRVSAGPTLHVGSEGARVVELRDRLRATGELEPRAVSARRSDDVSPKTAHGASATDRDAPPIPLREVPIDPDAIFDPPLEEAVQRFQRRHGLTPDGAVGAETLRELNVPVEDRVAQVELNLERWRWVPESLGARYVFVNVAGFDARAVENGETVLTSAVVAGEPDPEWQTPLLQDVIDGVDVNPVWHVPPKIAREDLVKVLARRPAYAAQLGVRAFRRSDGAEVNLADIHWTAAETAHYRFEQDAGPHNPLGEARVAMHNRHAVYLHGASSAEAFQLTQRALSHGCVRVERIRALVEWMLADAAQVARYRALVAGGAQARLPLASPVPVYLGYFTAWVDDDGVLQLRRDVYGQDAALKVQLAKPAAVVTRAER